jgi:hypothetical protein
MMRLLSNQGLSLHEDTKKRYALGRDCKGLLIVATHLAQSPLDASVNIQGRTRFHSQHELRQLPRQPTEAQRRNQDTERVCEGKPTLQKTAMVISQSLPPGKKNLA